MYDWKKLGQRTRAIGYRPLIFKKFLLPDGKQKEFSTYGVEAGRDVAIIALTSDYQVVMARQYRPGPEKVLDELPGGSADGEEDLEVAAKRELLEETGYEVNGEFKYLGQTYRDAYSNVSSHYFIGYDCVKVAEQNLEENEFIQTVTITTDQLFDNARQGKMTDAPAVLMAYESLHDLQSK